MKYITKDIIISRGLSLDSFKEINGELNKPKGLEITIPNIRHIVKNTQINLTTLLDVDSIDIYEQVCSYFDSILRNKLDKIYNKIMPKGNLIYYSSKRNYDFSDIGTILINGLCEVEEQRYRPLFEEIKIKLLYDLLLDLQSTKSRKKKHVIRKISRNRTNTRSNRVQD